MLLHSFTTNYSSINFSFSPSIFISQTYQLLLPFSNSFYQYKFIFNYSLPILFDQHTTLFNNCSTIFLNFHFPKRSKWNPSSLWNFFFFVKLFLLNVIFGKLERSIWFDKSLSSLILPTNQIDLRRTNIKSEKDFFFFYLKNEKSYQFNWYHASFVSHSHIPFLKKVLIHF